MSSVLQYFFFFVLFYAFLYRSLKINPGNEEDEDDYTGVNTFISLCLMSFRNSIADLSPPDYGYWLTEVEKKDGQKVMEIESSTDAFFVTLIWFIWFTQTMIMVIVMLNLLITVVSEVFEETIGETIVNRYSSKSYINLRYFMILKQLKAFDMSIKFMVFTT